MTTLSALWAEHTGQRVDKRDSILNRKNTAGIHGCQRTNDPHDSDVDKTASLFSITACPDFPKRKNDVYAIGKLPGLKLASNAVFPRVFVPTVPGFN